MYVCVLKTTTSASLAAETKLYFNCIHLSVKRSVKKNKFKRKKTPQENHRLFWFVLVVCVSVCMSVCVIRPIGEFLFKTILFNFFCSFFDLNTICI